MWTVYRYIDKPDSEKYVITEVSNILENISTYEFKEILYMLSPKNKIENPLQAVLLFTKGLNINKFFEFKGFIKGINGSSN